MKKTLYILIMLLPILSFGSELQEITFREDTTFFCPKQTINTINKIMKAKKLSMSDGVGGFGSSKLLHGGVFSFPLVDENGEKVYLKYPQSNSGCILLK